MVRTLSLIGCLAVAAALVVTSAGAVGTLDQSQPQVNPGFWAYGNCGTVALAQTFTAGTTGDLDQVDLFVWRDGAAEVPLQVQIQSVSVGDPSGTVLASASVPFAAVATAPFAASFVSIGISPPLPVGSGRQYAIVLPPTELACFAGYWWAEETGNLYSAGAAYVNVGGTGWQISTLAGLEDMAFKTYVTPSVDTVAPVLSVPEDFAVDATSPGGAVVDYTASATDGVDPEPVFGCLPASGMTFPVGDTTVTCNAADAAGNSAQASFSVHVKGAAEQVDDLNALVDSYDLGKLGTSLHDKLVTVQRFLAAGKPRQAEDNLEAFINQVEAQRGKGLSQEQADALESAAQRVMEVIEP